MKKILITTYYFYPEVIPRSFRTFELAKSLSKLGYKVDVIIPKNEFDYTDVEVQYGLTIIKVPSGFFLNKVTKKNIINQRSIQENYFKNIIQSLIKKIFYCIYMGGKNFEYAYSLYNFLKKKKGYDGIISIGLPISVHIGTAMYIKNLDKTIISIADYGDPFSFNKEIPSCFYYRVVEKYILNRFTYISVPIKNAVEKYLYFKKKDEIIVIPQSYDFSNLKVANYSPNQVVTFGYAGLFYKEIRNPKILFEFLSALEIDFRFIIYTDTSVLANMALIEPYKVFLGDKLVIKDLIARNECIYELSKMDFLINQNNLLPEQFPSKLIDYMLAMRPVFHFSQNHFSKNNFLALMENPQNNIESLKIKNHMELQKYDSLNVAKTFLSYLNLE